MASRKEQERHERWLLELTSLPTAAGCEQRVRQWINGWIHARRAHLKLDEDRHGNMLIRTRRSSKKPMILFTAHLDHPAFVVRRVIDDSHVELEFRGGVRNPYFIDAKIHLFDQDDARINATITETDFEAKPFKRFVARTSRSTRTLQPEDVGRWALASTRIRSGKLHAHACDDLAAVAAALAAYERLYKRPECRNVGLFFTVAEEIGLLGAIGAARTRSVPKSARLICLENSRSFQESPIGGGPILRVGDAMTCFSPDLTNRIGAVMKKHAAKNPDYAWQRKLMPGGQCEATAFAAYGYQSTCLCLPLGNYHNMADLAGVEAGAKRASAGHEIISVSDFHGLVTMLEVCGRQLDSLPPDGLKRSLDKLWNQRKRYATPDGADARR